MLKALSGLAAGSLLLAFATVTPADAKVREGATGPGIQAEQSDEVSSQRRYRRGGYGGHRGWHGSRYAYRGGYRPYYGGGYYPYYAAPRAYYAQPYYGYGPSLGFGFGFGPRWY